jgi:aminoglycoside 6-adenylyltransferase
VAIDVLAALLEFADADDNIRAVLLEGSRANPDGLVDQWSDYDVAFITHSNGPYLVDGWFEEFARQFGRVTVARQPDDPALFDNPHNPDQHYAYLTQFADGLRLDLTFETVVFLATVELDSATKVLRDKDGIIGSHEPSSDDYLVQAPTAREFAACCNEFWWTVPYAAKAVARGQALAASELLGRTVRPEFAKMLSWLAVARHGSPVALGKHLDRIADYVPADQYATLLASYGGAALGEVTASLLGLVRAFDPLAATVAKAFGLTHDAGPGDRVNKLLASYFHLAARTVSARPADPVSAEALRQYGSMISKLEMTLAGLAETAKPQRTLATRRIEALRIGEALVRRERNRGGVSG